MSESKQTIESKETLDSKEYDFTDMDSFISHIFSNLPQDPLSIKFIPVSEEPDEEETSLVFEMLINIYMEGMIDAERLVNILTIYKYHELNNVQKYNYEEIKEKNKKLNNEFKRVAKLMKLNK